MNNNYTAFNEQSINNFTSIDDNLEDAVDFIKNPSSFRSFDKGLKELLRRKGYQGNLENYFETSDYLISKLRSINSTIEDETVYSWFSGKHRPKIEAGSRKKIYEICFALDLEYKEVVWFFNHVYYDRAFNCHNIDEAVFYYAFTHDTPYNEALDIISDIKNSDSNENMILNEQIPNYTQFIQAKISDFKSEKELKDFLISNKENFKSWNNSALNVLKNLLAEIIGSESSKTEIDNLKRTLSRKLQSKSGQKHLDSISIKDYEDCGLLIKEIIYDAKESTTSAAEFILEAISGKNIRKNTFVLDRLLSTITGMPKKADIPYIVKNNFPSKKVMSDVLDESKISTSKSYDSIRKMIVLLDFYTFWVRVKIGITDISDFDEENLFEIYKDEADSRLFQCGYEPLYAGNPYDWIFLCSSKNSEPLDFFRSCIADLLPEE